MALRDTAVAAVAALAALVSPAASARAGDQPHTLYMLHCSGCHGADGSGSRLGRVPGMPGFNRFLLHPDGRRFLANVPGIKSASLSADDTAALLNWAMGYWGDASVGDTGPALTGEEIDRLQADHVDDIAALRAVIAADLLARGIDIGTYAGN